MVSDAFVSERAAFPVPASLMVKLMESLSEFSWSVALTVTVPAPFTRTFTDRRPSKFGPPSHVPVTSTPPVLETSHEPAAPLSISHVMTWFEPGRTSPPPLHATEKES